MPERNLAAEFFRDRPDMDIDPTQTRVWKGLIYELDFTKFDRALIFRDTANKIELQKGRDRFDYYNGDDLPLFISCICTLPNSN